MSATDDLRAHAAASFAAPSAIKGEDVWVEVRELRAENVRLTREVERLIAERDELAKVVQTYAD